MPNETITESEIWADIDAVFALPSRLPGDIDVQQLAQHYGISDNAARDRMRKMVSIGGWQILEVSDPSCNLGRRNVIRRVK